MLKTKHLDVILCCIHCVGARNKIDSMNSENKHYIIPILNFETVKIVMIGQYITHVLQKRYLPGFLKTR